MGRNNGGAGRGARRSTRGAVAPAVAPTAGPPQTAGLLRESQFINNTRDVGGTEYNFRSYEFYTADGKARIEMTIGSSYGIGTVGFAVNGSTLDAHLPQDVANAVSLRLMRHMREDARTRPNGFRYMAYAQEGDTKTAQRAVAYQAIGMSRPTYARAGNMQYATVRNGKLTPDNDALRLEEGNNAFNLYNDAWRGVVDNFKDQRNRQR